MSSQKNRKRANIYLGLIYLDTYLDKEFPRDLTMSLLPLMQIAKNSKIVAEYRQSTKNVPEIVNAVFYRPLAFPIVKLGAKLKLTPNFFTWLSFIASMIAALLLGLNSLIWGGIFVFLKQLLDCVDGSLARLTHQFSKNGAKLDFTCDIIGMVVIMVAIPLGQISNSSDDLIFLYASLAGASFALHTAAYTFLKDRYTRIMKGLPEMPPIHLAKTAEMTMLEMMDQVGHEIGQALTKVAPYPDLAEYVHSDANLRSLNYGEIAAIFEKKYKIHLYLWSLIEGGFSITWMVVCSLIGNFYVLWYVFFGVNNVIMILLLLYQSYTTRNFGKYLA